MVFFQNQMTLLLAQFHCPSRSFGYRPRTTCSGCWTVLAAIWFNIKLVSSVGGRFFDSSQLQLTIFHSLRFPWFTIFGDYRMQTWCGSIFAG